jgi:hypothetical protein
MVVRAQALDPARIAARTDTLEIVAVRGGDTVPVGILFDAISRGVYEGHQVLLRVYRSQSALLGSRVDTLIDAAESLQPLRIASRTVRGSDIVVFADGRASGYSLLANGDSVDIDVAIAQGVISGSSLDLAIRASELAADSRLGFQVFLPSTRSVSQMDARVAGAETVDGESCWRVDANFAGTPVSFWVGRDSYRLLRQVMTLRPDFQLVFRRPRG